MVFYRLKQLFKAIRPNVKAEEVAWLEEVLTENELSLFLKQLVIEQRHALDVAHEILRKRSDIIQNMGETAYIDLIKAAFLHDCGKSLIKIRLWQRVFIVSYNYLPQRIKFNISTQKNLFSKTIIIYQQHPSWGRKLAAKAGLNHQVQELIGNHHSPVNQLEQILFEADNMH
ncbi:MAG: hypothetical protein APF84_02855 [Gracilibacter sp. BRH_c7a]|nr:MAG: hypothetical protein APF84_02855 [Gracilibacter sp. BRH_c7a]